MKTDPWVAGSNCEHIYTTPLAYGLLEQICMSKSKAQLQLNPPNRMDIWRLQTILGLAVLLSAGPVSAGARPSCSELFKGSGQALVIQQNTFTIESSKLELARSKSSGSAPALIQPLGLNLAPYKTPQGNNGQYSLFSKRKIVRNKEKVGAAFRELIIDPLIGIDSKTNKELFNSRKIEASVKSALEVKYEGQLESFGLDGALVSESMPLLIFTAETNDGKIHIISYNVSSQKAQSLVSFKAQPYEIRALKIDDATSTVSLNAPVNGQETSVIIDLRSGEALTVEGNFDLKLSSDRKIVSASNGEGTFVAKFDDPKLMPKRLRSSDFTNHIQGKKVLAVSPQIDAVIINELESRRAKDSSYDNQIPNLKFSDPLTNAEVRLEHWSEIKKRLEALSEAGFGIRYQGVSGQFSKDGRYFTLHLKFHKELLEQLSATRDHIHTIEKDAVIVWDIRKNQLVAELTSTELDTPRMNEGWTGGSDSIAGGAIWKRNFAFRQLSDGSVVASRATLHELGPQQFTVGISTLIKRANGSQEKYESLTDTFNPFIQVGKLSTHIGIPRLTISTDGNTVTADIVGLGAHVVTLRKSLSAPRAPVASLSLLKHENQE